MIDFRTSSPDRYRILKDFARENRKNMTEAESVLWNSIRNKGLGVKFLRQHIIGDYIVDFVCQETGLIIEVDGGYHSEPCQKEEDDTRTRYLESKGFKVIRFTNEEILFNIESVINRVYNLIK